MARTQDAVDRILYLLGRGDYRATPSTLNGGRGHVRSYAKSIVTVHEDGTILVTTDASTPTTNRHINAAHQAMCSMGYISLGELDDDGWIHYQPA